MPRRKRRLYVALLCWIRGALTPRKPSSGSEADRLAADRCVGRQRTSFGTIRVAQPTVQRGLALQPDRRVHAGGRQTLARTGRKTVAGRRPEMSAFQLDSGHGRFRQPPTAGQCGRAAP